MGIVLGKPNVAVRRVKVLFLLTAGCEKTTNHQSLFDKRSHIKPPLTILAYVLLDSDSAVLIKRWSTRMPAWLARLIHPFRSFPPMFLSSLTLENHQWHSDFLPILF
jgi:hypothetical protein